MMNDIQNKAAICYQILIQGTLQLDSPLLIGTGKETDSPDADIHVLKDANDQPFIPGTSVTGVLRHIMLQENAEKGRLLFGYSENNGDTEQDSLQSAIAIQDILLENTEIVIRDGVCIDFYTGIAKEGQKYNYEAIERSLPDHMASGEFRMQVTLRQYLVDKLPDWKVMVQQLTNQLVSGIQIGALTSKGFGRVSVPDIEAGIYDFTKFSDVRHWLLQEPGETIYKGQKKIQLQPGTFVITGHFSLKSSLLIRSQNIERENLYVESSCDSYIGQGDDVDVVPMRSGSDYLIPGTTIKGVLRHHSDYILQSMGKENIMVSEIKDLMGCSDKQSIKKSRFFTDEVYINPESVTATAQTRNAIDRFTGSTMDAKLFTEKALWQTDKKKTTVTIRYTISQSHDWERGLALFLLKDLCTGHVAIGGDKAVGRGYLQGINAVIEYGESDGTLKTWQLSENGTVIQGNASELESYAAALVQYKGKEDKL